MIAMHLRTILKALCVRPIDAKTDIYVIYF